MNHEEITLEQLEDMSRPDLVELGLKLEPPVKLGKNNSRQQMIDVLAVALKLKEPAKATDGEPRWRVTLTPKNPEDTEPHPVMCQEEVVYVPKNKPVTLAQRFYEVLKNAIIDTRQAKIEIGEDGKEHITMVGHTYHRFNLSAERVS